MKEQEAETCAAIARWTGYTDVTVNLLEGRGCPPNEFGAYGIHPKGSGIKWCVPDYTTSRDAMHDVLRRVDDTDFKGLFLTLLDDELRNDYCSYEGRSLEGDWRILTAEPAVLAKVFVETLHRMELRNQKGTAE